MTRASVREYAILYVGGKGTGKGSTSGGGNVLLTTGTHRLDGPEHAGASDSARLDASTSAHGLLPKLSGPVTDVLGGDGAFRPEGLAVPFDHDDMGAAETIDVSGGHDWHRGNLDVPCTITVSGFTVDEGRVVVVELTGTGAITWDPDVTAAGDDQPDASGYTVFVLFTSAGDSAINLVKVGGSGGSALEVKDEGSSLDAAVTSIDAVGAGITATVIGHAVTLTVPGTPTGAAGGELTGTYPNPTVVTTHSGSSHAATQAAAEATAAAALAAHVASSGSGSTDHAHVMDILMSGDASRTAFELPAAPFDAYSVAAYVSGVLTEVTLSGALLTTATFGSAPASASNNIRFDIVAAVA